MKKSILIILIITVTICSATGIIFSGIYSFKTYGIKFLKYVMFSSPEDTSAEYTHGYDETTSAIKWNGKKYVYDRDLNPYYAFDSGKAVARLGEYGKSIYEVSGDGGRNFLITISFPEGSDLYIANDYVIPEEGEVTAVYIDGNKLVDAKLLDALEKIYSEDHGNTFLYKVSGNFFHDEKIEVTTVHLSYEGCPIGSDYKGYLGRVDGKWCYFYDDPIYTATQKETIPCFEIDEDLIPIIEEYFYYSLY